MLVSGFDGCKRCVSRVFHECFAGVSQAWCFAGVLRVFCRFRTGCFASFAAVSRLSRSCFALSHSRFAL